MIIEFDGYGINEYVAGQCVSITKLKRMYLNVKHEGISNGGA
ncbi:Glutamate-rich protein grpB [Bacillus cereus]|nr:Glutamate-rich protein grpB [Bacillus cereus]